jgi:NitT/TauT family transport system substrate-binding protein
MLRSKGIRVILVLVLLAGFIQACTGQSAPQEAPDLNPIQVGYIPILGFAPFFVAAEKGYFEEQGLEVELQSFRSGGPMIAPLSTGQIDVGGGESGTALFNAINQDFDVIVTGALASQPPGYGAVPLLVRKDLSDSGEIKDVADLRGRKVAINVERGTAEYLLGEALAKAGMTVDDVEIVTLPFPDMPAALANQAVEAAVLPHPLASRAIGDGSAVVLVDGDKIVDTPQNGVLYFGKRFLDPANKEAGIRFLVAYLMAARDLFGDGWRTEENAAIINKYTNVPIPAIQNGVPYYFEPDGQINRASTEKFQEYMVGRGYTDYSDLIPLSEIIDESFLKEAVNRLGKFQQ